MDIDGIEAKGRNGYFFLETFTVRNLGQGEADVLFYSKIRTRRGRDTAAPIRFASNDRAKLIKLFKGVVKKLEALGR